MIRAISFDLDGTLVVKNFADPVWFEGIPRLYSKRWGVSFSEALKRVRKAYDGVGPGRLEWYDVRYWLRRFKLGDRWPGLKREYGGGARLYPEVMGTLEELKRDYDLVIVSAAAREFIDLVLERTQLRDYLLRSFSAVSDFGIIGKKPELFCWVCRELGLKPRELLHVGDDATHDFEVPRMAGASALLLDRDGELKGPHVIRSLRGVIAKIKALEQFKPSQ